MLATGDSGDKLSIPGAARLVGVRRGYPSQLCRNYLDHRDEISSVLAAGETPKRAFLVCWQEEDGSYRVTRANWPPTRSGADGPRFGSDMRRPPQPRNPSARSEMLGGP